MKERVYHVIGFTQYIGTCKFHLFKDCHQLQKKRVSHMAWGDRVSTGHIYEDEVEIYHPNKVCKICQNRKSNELLH